MPRIRRCRVSLGCLYCGHEVSEVVAPRVGRPTYGQLRATYAREPDLLAPAWGPHGEPRCPRCNAALFMELTATTARDLVPPRAGRTATHETTEDEYARQDVYARSGEPPA